MKPRERKDSVFVRLWHVFYLNSGMKLRLGEIVHMYPSCMTSDTKEKKDIIKIDFYTNLGYMIDW